MSVPSPYSQTSSTSDARCRVVPNKNEQAKEDCRDYLRTGRCKYGASCKYNHPLNVQSGGGMKAPINPSEPLFPIRYNEPVCQYYMKHGTCKFGQACKFHHPPELAGTGSSNVMNGSNGVLVSVPIGGRKDDGGSRASPMWRNGNDSSAQMLPQRPEEPNCIFFLKNGRCKYGATCRYHHPLNGNRNRNGYDDGRGHAINNRQSQEHRGAHKVHYVTALPPVSMQQGHFVVADGTVTFLSLDGNAPAHVVSITQPVNNGGKEYTNPGTGTIASSTSSTSIASSFEASVSNTDHIDASASSLWNGRKTGGNVGSGYGLPGVVSTGSIQNDGSNSVQYDSNTGPSTWRGHRSSSFDHTRTRSSSLSIQEDDMRRSTSVHSALNERTGGRPRSLSTTSSMMYGGNRGHRDIIHTPNANGNAMRAQHRPGEVDDGLSMMTSALLTMLDTTADKAPAQQYDEYHDPYNEIDERRNVTSSLVDDHFARCSALHRSINGPSEDLSRGYHSKPNMYYEQTQFLGQNNHIHDYQTSELSTSMSATTNDSMNFLGGHVGGESTMHQTSRIQSWQGSATAGVIHENAQFSTINPNQTLSSNSPDTSTNIGLSYY